MRFIGCLTGLLLPVTACWGLRVADCVSVTGGGEVKSGEEVFVTQAHKAEIKSLRVRKADGRNGDVLVLGGRDAQGGGGVTDGSERGNTLEISFDCLNHDTHYYTYEVWHLNRDFTRSALQEIDYLQGYTKADITEYELSVNTQQIYTHYQFYFPNEDMQLKCSGNYVLRVYEDGDRDNKVADFCFSVTESVAGVSCDVRANTTVELNGRYQHLDVAVDMRHAGTYNPDEVTLVVRQNGRRDNMAVVTRPTFAEPHKLRYENQKALVFEGGNEYRHFDIFSVYFAGWNVDRVVYDQGEYHALLEADSNRGVSDDTGRCGTPYISEQDNNGGFVINAEKSDDDDTEADYMWVHWTLPAAVPFFDGTVYVIGELFQNRLTLQNRMIYDNDRHCYYLNALMKQGAYDYQYLFRAKNGETTLLRTEGSHWETANTYTAYVWFRPFGARADRLIGCTEFNNN